MAIDARRIVRRQSSRTADGDAAAESITMSASDLWKSKRELQRTDIEGLESGRLTIDDVSWFTGGVTRKGKLVGTLF